MLYEPTNITPSTLTGTGAVDVNDTVNISWQVNGNSKLTEYQITIKTNDVSSTVVGSTDITTAAFYGRNQLGEVQLFNVNLSTPWAEAFGIENGKSYKLIITQYYDGGSVEQLVPAVFNTYATPTVWVTIANLSEDNTLTQSIISATATYAQEQGNNIQSVRWQLSSNGTVIDDTGLIDTACLAYEYGGAQNNTEYTLTCTVTSEAGQTKSESVTFAVSYEEETYEPNFTVQCLCQEDGNLLEWELLPQTSVIIAGVAEPVTGYSINASANQLLLQEGATVTWNTVQTESDTTEQDMNFSAPWTAVWKGEIENPITELQNITTAVSTNETNNYGVAFNSDGTLLVVGRYLYSVSGDSFNKLASFPTTTCAAAFDPKGRWLISARYLYKLDGTTATQSKELDSVSSNLCACFNSDGTLAISGNILYSVSDSGLTKITAISSYSYGVGAFSPKNSNVFFYDGTIYTYNSDDESLTANTQIIGSNDELEGARGVAFSPSGNYILIGGVDFASLYSVDYSNGMSAELKLNVPSSTGKRGITAVAFYDDHSFFMGGDVSPTLCFYSYDDKYENYARITVDENGAAYKVAISPNGKHLIETRLLDGKSYKLILSRQLFNINGTVDVKYRYPFIEVYQSSVLKDQQAININSDSVVVALTPNKLVVNCFSGSTYLETKNGELSYAQSAITSISLTGEQTCDYLAVVDGDGSDVISNLSDPDFQFQWVNGDTYTLDLYANFVNDLEAGTGVTSNNGFMIYRTNQTTGESQELVRLSSTVAQIKDYGLTSNTAYTYTCYAYDSNGAFMGAKTAEIKARQFDRYSLLVTTYSNSDGCYHVVKEYQFGCNVQNMSVSNNANSSYVQNFTPYPTRLYSSANYASGTLQALIGFVDQTANKYYDDTKLMDELNALSTADYTLFLKDMKGHIRMVAPNGAITQTYNQKTVQMEVTISFPWVEIGDATKVSVIQLPTDEGWKDDAQILDVTLKVDLETGELIVTYPYPYYGTKFAYGKKNGTLNTSTPADVKAATVALEQEVGDVTATATVKTDGDNE